MERIQDDDATGDGLFTEGNPETGVQATRVTAEWLNDVQEELCNVIEMAGFELDDEKRDQVHTAIQRMIDEKRHSSLYSGEDNRLTLTDDGVLDHYVNGEYVFRVTSAGKLDRAKGGIDASLLTDKAKVSVIPHMFGSDGDGYVGITTNDRIEGGANLRLTGNGNLIYQYNGLDLFSVNTGGAVTTQGSVTVNGNQRVNGGFRVTGNPVFDGNMTAGDNSSLGDHSWSGPSMYVNNNRWAYASDFRIAFNAGQQRTETTAYGIFAVRSDGGVDAKATVDGNSVWHDGMSRKDYGASGYEIFPSGLMIQWGNANAGRNSFPMPFPNNVNKIVATDQDDNPDLVSVGYISRSQFEVWTGDNGAVYYIAIGY